MLTLLLLTLFIALVNCIEHFSDEGTIQTMDSYETFDWYNRSSVQKYLNFEVRVCRNRFGYIKLLSEDNNQLLQFNIEMTPNKISTRVGVSRANYRSYSDRDLGTFCNGYKKFKITWGNSRSAWFVAGRNGWKSLSFNYQHVVPPSTLVHRLRIGSQGLVKWKFYDEPAKPFRVTCVSLQTP